MSWTKTLFSRPCKRCGQPFETRIRMELYCSNCKVIRKQVVKERVVRRQRAKCPSIIRRSTKADTAPPEPSPPRVPYRKLRKRTCKICKQPIQVRGHQEFWCETCKPLAEQAKRERRERRETRQQNRGPHWPWKSQNNTSHGRKA